MKAMDLLSRTALIAAASLFASASASAQAGKVDFGKKEFQSNCASCHGTKGAGDGDYKPYLTKSPTDLTTLAKANGGVFPFKRVYEVIDGRQTVEAHGKRDMPVWGADYLVQAAGSHMDVPYDLELYVQTRIVALTDYIHRVQR